MYRTCILVLSLWTGLAACSSESDPQSIDRAAEDPQALLDSRAREFLNALAQADPNEVEAFLTERARAGLAGGGSWQIDGSALESWELVSTRVDAERGEVQATLVVNGANQNVTLDARLEDELWSFFGMTVELEGGVEWPIDFEAMAELAEVIGTGLDETLGDWDVASRDGQSAERRTRFLELSELSIREHDEQWQIDVLASNRTAAELLSEVLAGTGMEFERRAELDVALSCEWRAVSRLFVVEWLAREVGLRPVYPNLGGLDRGTSFEISFERGVRGPRNQAVACGPFLVEVAELREEPPHTRGALELSVRGLGLARETLALCGELREFIVVDDVSSSGTGDLRANPEVQYWTQPHTREGYFQADLSLGLRGLLRAVRSVDQVTGFVQLVLPVEVTESEIAALGPRSEEVTASAGAWDLKHYMNSGAQYVELRRSGTRMSDVSLLFDPRSAYGDPVDVSFESGMGFGDMFQGQLQLADEADSIGIKIAETRRLAYPFALEGLPLQSFAKQPIEELKLEFTGSRPLRIEFRGLGERSQDRGNVQLLLSNLSNKAITSALVSFVYLNDLDVALGEFPHSLSGAFDFEGPQSLVEAQAERMDDFAAFFLPEGTARVRVDLDAVKFIDGSTWDAP